MTTAARLLVALALGVAAVFSAAPPASAQQPASVRLAHLSPTTQRMDVWVSPFQGDDEGVLLPDVGYGAVSEYVELAPGPYVFTFRAAGAPATDPGLLSLSAVLEPGGAYTVAGVGQGQEVRSILIDDDLTPPAEGEAWVRFINADTSSGPVDLVLPDGQVLVQGADFTTVTGYGSVPAGPLTVQVVTAEAPQGAEMEVDLPAGSVNTLLLLETDSPVGDLSSVVDAPGMAMIAENTVMSQVRDAAGSPGMPAVGAVQAGAGGTAAGATAGAPVAALTLAAGAAISALCLVLLDRRRRCAR